MKSKKSAICVAGALLALCGGGCAIEPGPAAEVTISVQGEGAAATTALGYTIDLHEAWMVIGHFHLLGMIEAAAAEAGAAEPTDSAESAYKHSQGTTTSSEPVVVATLPSAFAVDLLAGETTLGSTSAPAIEISGFIFHVLNPAEVEEVAGIEGAPDELAEASVFLEGVATHPVHGAIDFTIVLDEGGEVPTLEVDLDLEVGEGFALRLAVDLSGWLEGIDFAALAPPGAALDLPGAGGELDNVAHAVWERVLDSHTYEAAGSGE